MTVRAQVDRSRGEAARPNELPWRRAAVAGSRLIRSSDVAIGYGVIVVGVVTVLSVLGGDAYRHVVAESSTNLANLRARPWAVLVTSAFVVSSPFGLWIVPLLMLGYAAAQRWVGRFGSIVVGAFGHIGATLVVATLLSAGISHGWVARIVVHETDVGVSYGLACVAAFLVSRLPARWRLLYVGVLLAYFVGPLAWGPSFTGVGHTVALTLGGLLAILVNRVARSATAADGRMSPATQPTRR